MFVDIDSISCGLILRDVAAIATRSPAFSGIGLFCIMCLGFIVVLFLIILCRVFLFMTSAAYFGVYHS